jgi:hypothetical protein
MSTKYRDTTEYIVVTMKWLSSTFECSDVERYILYIWFRIPSRGLVADDRPRVSLGNDMWIGKLHSIYEVRCKFYSIVRYNQSTGEWIVSKKVAKCVCGGQHRAKIIDKCIDECHNFCGDQQSITDAIMLANNNYADTYHCYGCWQHINRKIRK